MRIVRYLLVLGACTTGPAGPGGGGDSKDAAIDGKTGPMWVDAFTGDGAQVDCKPPATGFGNGEHNTGQNCQQSCHNHGFTLSGTLYTSPISNTGYAGATVTIRDSANRTIDVVVQANGNFYTSQAISFPALVRVSSCPYATPMIATVADGRCNVAGCHAQQGGAQMHLP